MWCVQHGALYMMFVCVSKLKCEKAWKRIENHMWTQTAMHSLTAAVSANATYQWWIVQCPTFWSIL